MSINVRVYVPDDWNPEKRDEIVAAFREVKGTHDPNPAVSAGASGLQPELLLLVTAAGAALAGGFLGAIGADIWRGIKAGIRKATKVKPDKMTGVPPEMIDRVPLEGVLIWEIRFEDLNALMILPLKGDVIEAALDALPDAIDRLYVKKKHPRFLRLHWQDDSWADYS